MRQPSTLPTVPVNTAATGAAGDVVAAGFGCDSSQIATAPISTSGTTIAATSINGLLLPVALGCAGLTGVGDVALGGGGAGFVAAALLWFFFFFAMQTF
jgi:hypothetical protein